MTFLSRCFAIPVSRCLAIPVPKVVLLCLSLFLASASGHAQAHHPRKKVHTRATADATPSPQPASQPPPDQSGGTPAPGGPPSPLAAQATGAQALPAPGTEAPLPPAFRNIFYQPNALGQGSPALVTVETAQPATRVTGALLGKQLSFFKGDKPDLWYALAGVDMETAPGPYDLSVSAVVARKGTVKAARKIMIAPGDFKSGALDVPENFVNPDAAGKRQIAADTALKARAYTHLLPTPQWSGDFKKPVDAPPTPSFGMTRVLNEEMSSQHRGTDFPAKEGSPVSASNAGTVVVAKEMFYEGNCIILDHGQHFFTVYMHLSKIDVKVGDKLKKGAPLGLSGATGRVTGPHLHMGVRWNGAYLDPTKLLALTLPETGAAPTSGPASARRPATLRPAARRRR